MIILCCFIGATQRNSEWMMVNLKERRLGILVWGFPKVN